jgi:hypothetical protein
MFKPTRIGRSPREHFVRAVEDEFSKFERKERAFRQAERTERAAQLGLPIDLNQPLDSDRRAKADWT